MAALLMGLWLLGCGANEAENAPSTPPTADPVTEETDPEPAPEAEPAPEPEPTPPEPEPVDVEAGARLGPIRIGMSEAEVRALGLPEAELDPRSRRFGPYRVWIDDDGVRQVEASMGALGRIRFGERVLEAGVHIHELRDAFGDCEWTEGGGERYRCAGRSLYVHTTHTMDPARYTLGITRP